MNHQRTSWYLLSLVSAVDCLYPMVLYIRFAVSVVYSLVCLMVERTGVPCPSRSTKSRPSTANAPIIEKIGRRFEIQISPRHLYVQPKVHIVG
jgi:hypothetical protein